MYDMYMYLLMKLLLFVHVQAPPPRLAAPDWVEQNGAKPGRRCQAGWKRRTLQFLDTLWLATLWLATLWSTWPTQLPGTVRASSTHTQHNPLPKLQLFPATCASGEQ